MVKDNKVSSDGDEPPRKQKKQNNKKQRQKRRKVKVEKESSEKSGCYWRCIESESFSKTLEHAS